MNLNPFVQIYLKGYFQELMVDDNKLEFGFQLDQSDLPKTLDELKKIVELYGEMGRIKK